MRHSDFPCFQSHLDYAHKLWDDLLSPYDHALDATCGNGWDTLHLARLLRQGKIYAIDKQEKAIQKCQNLISQENLENVLFFQKCHSNFPSEIPYQSLKLIVYNLGYLPGSDKIIKTNEETTLESVKNALPLLSPKGAISITCYSGHEEGAKEELALQNFAKSLSPLIWQVTHFQWLNRHQSPSLLFFQKGKS